MYIIVNPVEFRVHGETFETIEDAFETLVNTYGTNSNYVLARVVSLYLKPYNEEEENWNEDGLF